MKRSKLWKKTRQCLLEIMCDAVMSNDRNWRKIERDVQKFINYFEEKGYHEGNR